MSARQVPLFDGAAFELAVLAFEESFRELQVATKAWVAGQLSHPQWFDYAQAYGRAVKDLRALGGHEVVADLIAGLRGHDADFSGPSQDPSAIRGLDHTAPAHASADAQNEAGSGVHTIEGTEQVFTNDPLGVEVESAGKRVTCTLDSSQIVVGPAEGGGGDMSKAQDPIALEARIEVLRARAEHHNAEARAAEVELAQLEVELRGCNPDAIDDEGFPLSEYEAFALYAEPDPFERQCCRGCGSHVRGDERARGFCDPCVDRDDERQTRATTNDNEESR